MKDVICPVCKTHGHVKLLLRVSDDTTGILYPKCRGCRNVVKIVIRAKSEPKDKGSLFVYHKNLH